MENSYLIRAYILIELEPGKELGFYEDMKKIQNIERIDLVHGAFDVLIMIDGELNEIDTLILKIRSNPSVRKTESLISSKMSEIGYYKI